jgi:uroporphyrin-III C-methyltransferase
MGVRNLPLIAEALIENGRDPATPVAVIERGLRRDQRVTVAPLDGIAALAAERGVRPPAVIVIGGVVELYDPASPVLTPAEGTTNLL